MCISAGFVQYRVSERLTHYRPEYNTCMTGKYTCVYFSKNNDSITDAHSRSGTVQIFI